MGTFQTMELIETFVNYHENIKKCVCLVYDPQRAGRGAVALRAIRLKETFIEVYKDQRLTGRSPPDPWMMSHDQTCDADTN